MRVSVRLPYKGPYSLLLNEIRGRVSIGTRPTQLALEVRIGGA
jgi:hypothetical protein